MLKKIVSLSLALVLIGTMAFGLASCSGAKESTNTDYNLTENIADGTILHCFDWDFETITNSLEDIAAAGYSTIQTSPINECLVGEGGGMQLYGDGKWYYHYQPTDYKIGNYQLGTRDEFKKMCEKADELGIKVIVDVVANHTTPTTSKLGEGLLDAVGGIENLFHLNSNKDISDYGDRLQCTTFKMGGLPDINTENKAYQDYIIDYLNDCVACGADGFRYDAAKHIGLPDDPTETKGVKNNFWTRILDEVGDSKEIFHYGEVLQGNNDRIGDYIDTLGACTASSYGGSLRNAIINNYVDTAFVDDMKVGDREGVVTWVESHDNYINDGNFMAMDNEQITLAWAIIAARGLGTPLFYSRPYGSSLDNQWGTMNRIGASGDYNYKDKSVVAVNFFRNAMVGEEEYLSNPDENSTSIQICRGDKGAVIVTTKDKLEGGFSTDLADGTYTDRVDNETVYTVKDGKLNFSEPIDEYTVVVLYNEGYTQYATPATVKISDDTSCIYDTDTLSVELVAENAKSATYSINDGDETEYQSGDTIEINSQDATDGVVTLTLRGESNAGQKTYMKYYFTNENNESNDSSEPTRVVKKGDSITFEKPDSWGDTIYAYIYGDGSEEAAWPGLEMTSEGGNKYSYNMQYYWEDAFVIFSDGNTQYPGENEQGLDLVTDGEYTVG